MYEDATRNCSYDMYSSTSSYSWGAALDRHMHCATK